MIVWGGLKNSCEQKRSKGKGEKERYSHLNAVFQRIARRDESLPQWSMQRSINARKTIEWKRSLQENKRYQGNFTWKDGKDLTEAENIKKSWQEYTGELYRKGLHDPDNHDGMITHLELDILKCEVKWALGSITMIKASGGDGIPVELFQILEDDAVKVLYSICQQIWKTQQWP